MDQFHQLCRKFLNDCTNIDEVKENIKNEIDSIKYSINDVIRKNYKHHLNTLLKSIQKQAFSDNADVEIKKWALEILNKYKP